MFLFNVFSYRLIFSMLQQIYSSGILQNFTMVYYYRCVFVSWFWPTPTHYVHKIPYFPCLFLYTIWQSLSIIPWILKLYMINKRMPKNKNLRYIYMKSMTLIDSALKFLSKHTYKTKNNQQHGLRLNFFSIWHQNIYCYTV